MVERETRSSRTDRNGDKPGTLGGEFRSGPIAGTLSIEGATFRRKSVAYANVDGLAMFEGDIILGRVEEIERAAASADAGVVLQSVGITGQQFRWPNAIIPYEIDPTLPDQQRVADATAHWQAHTRIRFVLRTVVNAIQYPDYVRFVPGGGCSSQVGRRGGQQIITLAGGCDAGRTIHEIGHSVGLWHEQSREDRDQFVTIVWANIDPAMQHNFTQHITDGDDLGPYDYGSIMHYPRDAFSINNQDTIIPKQPLPPGVVMGQRVGLSAGDIAGVHMLYPQVVMSIKEPVKDPPKDPFLEPTIKEVAADPTIKEVGKDPFLEPTIKEVAADPTIKEVGKDPFLEPTIKEVAADPTIKEVAFDPGPFPGPSPGPFPGPLQPTGTPFVLATPHQAPGLVPQQAALAAAAQRVQSLAQALTALDRARVALAAEHDALAAQLGGQGGLG